MSKDKNLLEIIKELKQESPVTPIGIRSFSEESSNIL